MASHHGQLLFRQHECSQFLGIESMWPKQQAYCTIIISQSEHKVIAGLTFPTNLQSFNAAATVSLSLPVSVSLLEQLLEFYFYLKYLSSRSMLSIFFLFKNSFIVDCLKCTIQQFLAYLESCKHHHDLIWEHFHHPQKKPYAHKQSLPDCPSAAVDNH